MSQKEGKRFQSGREVFEKFIPGYTTPSIDSEKHSWDYLSTPRKIADEIMSDFVENLSKIIKTDPTSPKQN